MTHLILLDDWLKMWSLVHNSGSFKMKWKGNTTKFLGNRHSLMRGSDHMHLLEMTSVSKEYLEMLLIMMNPLLYFFTVLIFKSSQVLLNYLIVMCGINMQLF